MAEIEGYSAKEIYKSESRESALTAVNNKIKYAEEKMEKLRQFRTLVNIVKEHSNEEAFKKFEVLLWELFMDWRIHR